MMNIGRNDPCPCGSGKKYKKCCLNKHRDSDLVSLRDEPLPLPVELSEDDHTLVKAGDVGDYGAPVLTQELFNQIPPKDLSAYSLVWNLAKRPDLVAKANQMIKPFISRGRDEAKRIKQAEDAHELVQIMLSNPDPINHPLLFDRVLEKPASCIPLIISELAKPQRNSFAELAVKVIYRSNFYPEDDLLALVTQPNATAYDLSLICMLLGMIEVEDAIKPLWDYYHFFRERFPDHDYWKGPLTGLADLKHRQDNPIELSPEQRDLIVQTLQQSGISVSPSAASRIVTLVYTRRILKLFQLLSERIGKPGEEEQEQAEHQEKLMSVVTSILQVIKQFPLKPENVEKA